MNTAFQIHIDSVIKSFTYVFLKQLHVLMVRREM